MHVEHAALPIVFLNFPSTHCMHGPPNGPVNPGMQSHFGAPGAETEFAGQTEHSASPFSILNVFSSQSVHTPPSGPVAPGLHVQITLAESEFEFTGQSAHSAEPVAALNFPGMQNMQLKKSNVSNSSKIHIPEPRIPPLSYSDSTSPGL